jgi:hypothetical protein
MAPPFTNALWFTRTSWLSRGASLFDKTLETSFPIMWMREMGQNSFTVIASSDLGNSTKRASLTLCIFLVSKCQKASKAAMISALIIGHVACKSCQVKPSDHGALSVRSDLIASRIPTFVKCSPRFERLQVGRSKSWKSTLQAHIGGVPSTSSKKSKNACALLSSATNTCP